MDLLIVLFSSFCDGTIGKRYGRMNNLFIFSIDMIKVYYINIGHRLGPISKEKLSIRRRRMSEKSKALLVFILFGCVISVDASSVAQTRHYPGWGMGPGMMYDSWGWFGGILMIVFWVLVIVAVVFLIRYLASTGRTGSERPGASESALDILKKRYARGEINKAEYESMKRDIE